MQQVLCYESEGETIHPGYIRKGFTEKNTVELGFER